MGDLDENLLEAIYRGVSLRRLDKVPENSTNWFKVSPSGGVYEFVIEPGTIKQAFTDAGWKKHDKAGCVQFDLGEEQKAVLMAKVTEMMMFREPVMTGHEWYDRFIKSLPLSTQEVDAAGMPAKGEPIYIRNAVLRAAKKASGIE